MNWTASLLRQELKKQKLTHQERINLLTQVSIDVQNFLLLEEKVKELEANLKTSKQNIKEIQNELKNKEELSSQQLEVKETELVNLKEKIKEDKEQIFNLQKEIRELNLYHQRDLRKVKENYQAKLTPLQKQVAELKLSLLSLPNKKTKGKEEKILAELKVQWNQEKEQLQKEHSVQIAKLNKDYQLLQKQAKKTEKQLEKLTKKQSKTEQSLTNSQAIFSELEKIIDKTTITPHSKKKIRGKITEFKQLLGWGESAISESEEEIISSPELAPTETFPISEKEEAKEQPRQLSVQEKKWRNISPEFTEELIKQWTSQGFNYLQTKAWIDIGFSIQKADFAWWLEKEAHFTPLDYLNQTSPEEQAELIRQFAEYKKSKP